MFVNFFNKKMFERKYPNNYDTQNITEIKVKIKCKLKM